MEIDLQKDFCKRKIPMIGAMDNLLPGDKFHGCKFSKIQILMLHRLWPK